jgi:hypothetical protein
VTASAILIYEGFLFVKAQRGARHGLRRSKSSARSQNNTGNYQGFHGVMEFNDQGKQGFKCGEQTWRGVCYNGSRPAGMGILIKQFG